MKQLLTTAIVLSRTDYSEADRIVTFLTPEYGKLRLMARGVRKVKSKLAGGVELFSVSEITFVQGRGEIGTLISARLVKHYGSIVQQLERVQLGYDLIKLLNKVTEDEPDPDYFTLLEQALTGLNLQAIGLDLINFWFQAQLLRLGGHTPNLTTDTADHKLDPAILYDFDFEAVAFRPRRDGRFGAIHIKGLRLLFSQLELEALARVQDLPALLSDFAPLITTLRSTYLRN